MPISMSRDQYEALLDYANGRRTDAEGLADLQRAIDAANSVRRYSLYIRWMERGGSAPSRISIAAGWPPTQQFLLVLDRPIERADVDEVLNTQATSPVYVTVTSDVRGEVGWTEIDEWDFHNP
jgi:hypothetical protein